MMSHTEQNQLLAALPRSVKDRIIPQLRLIELPVGKVIFDAGQEVSHVYFPTDSIISLIHMTLDGHSAEVSVVGHEGIVGVSAFMGATNSTSRAVVHSGGQACRLPAADLMREFEKDATARTLMLRYTQALITQMAQTAVCNRHHTVF